MTSDAPGCRSGRRPERTHRHGAKAHRPDAETAGLCRSLSNPVRGRRRSSFRTTAFLAQDWASTQLRAEAKARSATARKLSHRPDPGQSIFLRTSWISAPNCVRHGTPSSWAPWRFFHENHRADAVDGHAGTHQGKNHPGRGLAVGQQGAPQRDHQQPQSPGEHRAHGLACAQ